MCSDRTIGNGPRSDMRHLCRGFQTLGRAVGHGLDGTVLHTMERARLLFMAPIIVVLMTLMDLADGTVRFASPTHPWWALTGFFAAALSVLFLALETCPADPITHINSSLGANIGYTLFGSFFAALTRSAMRTRLDVDTVLEILPVTVLSVSAFIVSVNVLARLLRPQKVDK